MRKTCLLILSGILVLSASNVVTASTMFQCHLDNHHTVTLDLSNGNGLVYDYRKTGDSKPALTLKGEDPYYAHILGANWSYQYFRFEKGAYSYIIYNRNDVKFGLAVFHRDKLTMNKACVSNVVLDREAYVYASEHVYIDADGAEYDFLVEE